MFKRNDKFEILIDVPADNRSSNRGIKKGSIGVAIGVRADAVLLKVKGHAAPQHFDNDQVRLVK